jgi:hypothetical protein
LLAVGGGGAGCGSVSWGGRCCLLAVGSVGAAVPDGWAGWLTAAARTWALGRDIGPSAVSRRR